MAIVRKDKMLAGYNGNLESVIVHDADNKTVEITNGVFVKITGLMADQREVEQAVLAGSGDVAEEVYFIHNAEVMYDERLYKLEDFRIKAGKVARAYHLFNGDIVTLTDDLFTDATVVDGKVTVRPNYSKGDKLVVKADGKLGLATDQLTADGAKIVFEVLEDAGNELHEEMQAFAVKVKK